MGEVKGDREAGWREVQKTFKYHKEIPPNHIYWLLLASTSSLFGHLDFAEQIAREKFSQADTMFHASNMLWSLGYSGKCDEAKPFAENLLARENKEDKVQALWVLTYCDFNKGKYDQVILYLKQLQAPPHAVHFGFASFYPKSFSLLGKIYEKKGDTKLAIENYKKLLALWKRADPDLPDLIEAKARLAKLRP